jgi:rRNA-processing protein FCF1
MRYLLDTNTLSNHLISKAFNRKDLFILSEVAHEFAFLKSEISKITGAGISILDVSKKHLEKLKEVMSKHGSNLKLIRLYTGKGTADVVMIAYILSERDNPETLFTEEYTLVTKDKELTSVAKSYNIKVVTTL